VNFMFIVGLQFLIYVGIFRVHKLFSIINDFHFSGEMQSMRRLL